MKSYEKPTSYSHISTLHNDHIKHKQTGVDSLYMAAGNQNIESYSALGRLIDGAWLDVAPMSGAYIDHDVSVLKRDQNISF